MYVVEELDLLYDRYDRDKPALPRADVVGHFLSEQEAEGFTLIQVIPDHRKWDDDNQPTGYVGAMLVLHKPD